MIVTPANDGLEVVTQSDHARLAAEFLALWRADGVPAHPRRTGLLLAVREHDNGWREADAAPRLDPATGRPLDFRQISGETRREIWLRGVARLAAEPYAAALVAQHGLELHRDQAAGDWEGFRDDLRRWRDEALPAAGLDREELAADYVFLALCDTLSLVACGAFERARRRGHAIRRRGETVEIEPFPLAGTTTFSVFLRVIGPGPYQNGADLIGQLAQARWVRRPLRLAPPGP